MKRLYRSRNDKKIAGICGGLGEMFSIDSTLIRLAVVFLGLVTAVFPVFVAYIVGWIIMPRPPPPGRDEWREGGVTADDHPGRRPWTDAYPSDRAPPPLRGDGPVMGQ